MLKDCLANTTAHGLPHLVDRDNSLTAKIVWGIIFLISTGVFCFHSGSLIHKYLLHDASVSVNLKYIDVIPPDIYICNNNRFSKLLVDLLELTNKTHYDQIFNEIKKYNSPAVAFMEDMGVVLNHSRQSLFKLLSDNSFLDSQVDVRFRGDNTKLFTAVFDIVPHTLHAFCYKMRDDLKENLFDFDGLEFSLYTDMNSLSRITNSSEMLDRLERSKLKDDASHTIYVVPRGEYPHLKSTKKKIEAGRKTVISISMNFYDRVSRESYPCMDPVEKVQLFNHLNESDDSLIYNSTPMDCAYSHLHRKLKKECDCIFGLQPYSSEDWRNATQCTLDDYFHDYSCFDRRSQNPEIFMKHCLFNAPCKMPVYSVECDTYAMIEKKIRELSFKLWSVLNERHLIKNFPEMSFDSLQNGPPKHVSQNGFATIVLQIPSLRATLWKENIAYDLKDLLSDIGGILGFYIGVSVVTCLEIFGYLTRWLSGKMSTKDGRSNPRLQDDADDVEENNSKV